MQLGYSLNHLGQTKFDVYLCPLKRKPTGGDPDSPCLPRPTFWLYLGQTCVVYFWSTSHCSLALWGFFLFLENCCILILDKDWLEWKFQLETYMTVMSTTMSIDIIMAETMQTSITMVGVTDQALANSRLVFLALAGSCIGAAAMVVETNWEPEQAQGLETTVHQKKCFWTHRVGNAQNNSVIQYSWKTE